MTNGDLYAPSVTPGRLDYLGTLTDFEPQLGYRWAGHRQYPAGRILTHDRAAALLLFRTMQAQLRATWVVIEDVYMRISSIALPTVSGPCAIECAQGGEFGYAEIDGVPHHLPVIEPSPPQRLPDWLPRERARVIRDRLGEPGDHLVLVPDADNPGHMVACDPWAPEFTQNGAGNDVRNP